jgi:xanthine/CO dehydrogenase XdhC/CoxF family maturation factor
MFTVLAVGAETTALIAGAAAVLGALVGATAGGIVDFVLERAREKREAMVGARLVLTDIALAASMLKEAEQTGKWWVFYETPMVGWHAHRAALGARLSTEAFEVVTQSVVELERFGQTIKQAPIPPGAPYRRIPTPTKLKPMRSNATAAFNTLQPLDG